MSLNYFVMTKLGQIIVLYYKIEVSRSLLFKCAYFWGTKGMAAAGLYRAGCTWTKAYESGRF